MKQIAAEPTQPPTADEILAEASLYTCGSTNNKAIFSSVARNDCFKYNSDTNKPTANHKSDELMPIYQLSNSIQWEPDQAIYGERHRCEATGV